MQSKEQSEALKSERQEEEESEEEVDTMRTPPDLHEVEEHTYLGDYDSATSIDTLKRFDIKYVLSVINVEVCPTYDSITYYRINADDFYLEDLLSHFPDTNRFISTGIESGHNVLVHCQMGRSRSATLVIAYIMNKYKISYKSARDRVKNKRFICPNSGFESQLMLYEEMGFTLDANNRELRSLFVKTVLNSETLFYEKWVNKINIYFQRLELAQQMTPQLDLGRTYVCANCGLKLFNEINIIKRESEDITRLSESTDSCDWVYIEPQKWMNQLFSDSDVVNNSVVKCSQCQQELVEYKRKFGYYICSCPLHIGLAKSLRFRIAKTKFKPE